jgi:hypothetical protein
MRVEPVNRVARRLEIAIAQVAARFAPVRNADNGDLLLSQEVIHQLIDFSHGRAFRVGLIGVW